MEQRAGNHDQRKVIQLSARKGVWLHSYDNIKHRTAVEWFANSVLGALGLIFGIFILWVVATHEARTGDVGTSVLIALAAICFGLVEFPAAVIYYYRRRHGKPVDVWDYETARPGHVRTGAEEHSRKSHAPDRP